MHLASSGPLLHLRYSDGRFFNSGGQEVFLREEFKRCGLSDDWLPEPADMPFWQLSPDERRSLHDSVLTRLAGMRRENDPDPASQPLSKLLAWLDDRLSLEPQSRERDFFFKFQRALLEMGLVSLWLDKKQKLDPSEMLSWLARLRRDQVRQDSYPQLLGQSRLPNNALLAELERSCYPAGVSYRAALAKLAADRLKVTAR